MADYSNKTTDELKILYRQIRFGINCTMGKNPPLKVSDEEILEAHETLAAIRTEINKREDRNESAVSWVIKEFNAGKYD